ncbi:MAG: ribonuclease Z [Lachnospiraceae bacterium]|nr:ribonuclease Z [Lachnospiraceae bacterium]MBR5738637.1 ribonuclease Z [Lachnospiraceae bacterium]
MLDVCLLGTGGMMPLPYRYLTSLLTRLNGSTLMIDCGEGTQMALRKSGFSPNPIDVICFTHYHGDHISGLPGLLLTMGNADRTEPLTLVGPKGLERVVSMLRVVAPELPFSLKFIEFSGDSFDLSMNGYRIHAFKVDHRVPCYGYTLTIDRLPAFDPVRAKEAEIPLRFWNRLQHGETVEEDGKVYTPDLVMGPPRKGLKVTYVTDTRPIERIAEEAAGSDLMIAEGMYGDPEKDESLKEKKHMRMQDACRLAAEAGVKQLWLTHFSPAMNKPKAYEDELKAIFAETVVPKDGECTVLRFEDEEE